MGLVDWDADFVEFFYTRILASFDLPVTFGGSGVTTRDGMSAEHSANNMARWIIAAMKPKKEDCTVTFLLEKLLLAVESYFYPTNTSNASQGLHSFVSELANAYVDRIHEERYDKKRPTLIPVKLRMTDGDIKHFVTIMKPVTMHILFGVYEEDKKHIFNCLGSLCPEVIIPSLLEEFRLAADSLTEPHRFPACVSALSALSRTLVEEYPEEIVGILMTLLPGLDLNDMSKCIQNFELLSALLDMIWLVDFSNPQSHASSPSAKDARVRLT